METTEDFILKNGTENLTISKIASQINLSQPAIYKHFKNKEDLMTTLALRFLNEQTLAALFSFDASNYTQKADVIHDWIWTLASSKRRAYEETPEMFALYTTYVGGNAELASAHILELVESLQATATLDSAEEAGTLLQIFAYFHHPKIAPQWDENYQQQFENVWALVKENYTEKTVD